MCPSITCIFYKHFKIVVMDINGPAISKQIKKNYNGSLGLITLEYISNIQLYVNNKTLIFGLAFEDYSVLV